MSALRLFCDLSRPHGEEPRGWGSPNSTASCAASRTMGPPHPSRRAPRRGFVWRKRMRPRPPQDEANESLGVYQPASYPAESALVAQFFSSLDLARLSHLGVHAAIGMPEAAQRRLRDRKVARAGIGIDVGGRATHDPFHHL